MNVYSALKACEEQGKEPLITYTYINMVGEEKNVVDVLARDLIYDWYNDCSMCPANDELIENLSLKVTDDSGKVCVYEVTGRCHFDTLMTSLRNFFVRRKEHSENE